MSNAALKWAFEQKVGNPARKAVLISLAEQADDRMFSCWPGQQLIADRTELGIRTVRRALAELETAGLVARKPRYDSKGHRTSDRYVLSLPATVTTGQSDRRSERPAVTHDRLPATAAGKPSEEPSEKPKDIPSTDVEVASEPARAATKRIQGVRSDKDHRFAAFWRVYPRRVGRAEAVRKYDVAIRRGVPPEVILAGAERYAAECRSKEERFIAHPSTWLHQGRWADDPARPEGQTGETAMEKYRRERAERERAIR